MLIINRPQTDPYFNLAAEEYLLKKIDEDCFMLWINQPSVVVGKHQNTFAEINPEFIKKNKIPVIRRISGGGTVFHDPGNLNFSFIKEGETGKLVDFKRFTQPIIDYLNKSGIPAKFEGKNDIRVNGLKISGNAEHVYKNKVLHHGTLLFSSELSHLNKSIKGPEDNFEDKAVKSVRSVVINISDLLDEPVTIEKFKEALLEFITEREPNSRIQELSESDIRAINLLAETRYKTWNWNFGYSPKTIFHKGFSFENQDYDIRIKIENGKISNVITDTGVKSHLPFSSIEGIEFSEEALLSNFQNTAFPDFLSLDRYRSLLTNLLY